jgi:3-hydroxybutyrate dehydrogenase
MPETTVTSADPGAGSDAAVLTGRRAVVTGGASGIGAAVSARLAELGAAVAVLDRDGEAAAKVAATIGGDHVAIDLTDGETIDALDLRADILINGAGIQHVAPLEDFDPAMFSLIHRLMLEAPFRLTRRLIPGMYRSGWGRIVHISSVHGHRASAYKSAYVSAKHGLEGLSKVIALEGGPRGVTSNCLCPAYVRTPLVENQIADQARIHGISEEEVIERIMLTEPAIKRLIESEEVAELAAFLCAPEASFINGASLVMDGGWTAR